MNMTSETHENKKHKTISCFFVPLLVSGSLVKKQTNDYKNKCAIKDTPLSEEAYNISCQQDRMPFPERPVIPRTFYDNIRIFQLFTLSVIC